MSSYLRTRLVRSSRLFSSRRLLTPNIARTTPFRSFHASPRPQYLESVLSGTHMALEALHTASGTPWVLTLPLAALIMRFTILLPGTIWQRKLLQRQASLAPLQLSWLHVYKKQAVAEVGSAGPEKYMLNISKKVAKKQGELYKKWQCQSWKTLTAQLSQFPAWLVVIETVRRMCGAPDGLLSILVKRVQDIWPWGANPAVENAVTEATTAIEPAAVQEAATQLVHMEPSFATEGALWFPDLLVADPYLILPFALSGAILLNIFGRTSARQEGVILGKWQLRLKRIMGTVALLIGPLMLHLPSGMLVYWISSTTMAYLQAIVLDKFMPIDRSNIPKKPLMPMMLPNNMPNMEAKTLSSQKP